MFVSLWRFTAPYAVLFSSIILRETETINYKKELLDRREETKWPEIFD